MPAAASEEKVEKAVPAAAAKYRGSRTARQVLLHPILSEKGTALAGSGRYVFAVEKSANKSEIRKNIQQVYNVTVEQVKIINLPSKKRRSGKSRGQTSPIKKAVVFLKTGDKIPGIVESVG